MDLTKAELRQEIMKCGRNPQHFICNYCKIQHPKRGKIPFSLYDFQKKVIDDFRREEYIIIVKSRQVGMSTVTAAYITWMMLFQPDRNIVVIATKAESAKNMVKKVRIMYENLPAWMKISGIKTDNKNSFELMNGSIVKATSTAADAGRSEAVSLLVIDEAAHIENMDEIWASIYPTLSQGGKGKSIGTRCVALSCVTKDTYILTDKGVEQIKDYIPREEVGDFYTKEYSVFGVNKQRKSNLFHNNGLVKTKKIITKFSELECSENHKLWAYKKSTNKHDWYKAEELEAGDYISISSGQNIFGNNDDISDFIPSSSYNKRNFFTPKKIEKGLAYFFGLFIAEGSSYKVKGKTSDFCGGNISISCGDDISWCFKELGLKYYTDNKIHYTVSSKEVMELFEHVGFEFSRHAERKIIPKRLLEMSKENIVYLLKGIFDGDGSAHKNKGYINLTSVSEELINQVRMLLINFGILSYKIRRDKDILNAKSNLINKFNYDSYSLEIGGEHAKKFFEEIGFWLDRKQNRYANCKEYSKNVKDSIPGTLDLFKRLYDLSGKSTWYYLVHRKFNVSPIVNKSTRYKSENISKEKMLWFYSENKHLLPTDERQYWDRVIGDTITWCIIRDIKSGDAETFDFSLPDDKDDFWAHSVIYNGVIGHQSPKGVGTWFHKTYVDAEQGVNEFYPINLPWNVHPERDEEWFENEKKNFSAKEIAQEYLCSFLGSGDTVIDTKDIEWVKSKVKEPLYKTGPEANVWVWEQYHENATYFMTCDVAKGDGGDYSTFHILNVNSCEVVCEFQGKIYTDKFAELIQKTATVYGKCSVVIESNGPGLAALSHLKTIGYKNIYCRSKSSNKPVDASYLGIDSDIEAGFNTTHQTRPLIVSKFEEYVRNKQIIFKSKRLADELDTFVWKQGGKPEAQRGSNDDLIMAAAIMCWIKDTVYTNFNQDSYVKQKMLASIFTSRRPFSSQIPGVPKPAPMIVPDNPYDSKPYRGLLSIYKG